MFFLGLASSLTNTTGMTLFATSAPAERRGAAMAAFSMALMTGQTLGPAIGGIVAGIGGWRAAQAVAAAIGIGVLVVCLLVPAGTAARREAPGGGVDGEGLSRLQALVLASVPFAVFFTLAALPQTLLPVIAAGDLDLTPAVIGIALGVGGIVRFAGSAVTGRLSDRVSRKAALVPSLLVMSIGAGILAAPVTVASWLTTIVLLSIASSGIAVAATIIADQVPAGTVGRRLGTFRFTGDLGLLAGPALTGLLYQHAGRAPAMLLTAGVLARLRPGDRPPRRGAPATGGLTPASLGVARRSRCERQARLGVARAAAAERLERPVRARAGGRDRRALALLARHEVEHRAAEQQRVGAAGREGGLRALAQPPRDRRPHVAGLAGEPLRRALHEPRRAHPAREPARAERRREAGVAARRARGGRAGRTGRASASPASPRRSRPAARAAAARARAARARPPSRPRSAAPPARSAAAARAATAAPRRAAPATRAARPRSRRAPPRAAARALARAYSSCASTRSASGASCSSWRAMKVSDGGLEPDGPSVARATGSR